MEAKQRLARPWERVEHVLAAALMAWVGYRALVRLRQAWPFTTDDAYITLRYARHLAQGHGIVWNVGDSPSVEGYSNFLFVLLGAAALKLGIDPALVLKASSCVALGLSSLLLYVLSRRWLSPLGAVLPPALLTAHKGSIYWSVSGLETSVYQLWVVAATVLAVRALDFRLSPSAFAGSSTASLRLCAVTCLLASLTRPEGPIVGIILAGTLLVADLLRLARAHRAVTRADGGGGAGSSERVAALSGMRQTLLAFLCFFALPYLTYFAWRLVTFERLLPNTVYCKAFFDGDQWVLLRHFWKDAKVFIVLALIQHPRRLTVRALPLFALPIAYALMLIGTDPVIAYYSRHFLAALSLLLVASATGAANLAELTVYLIRSALRFWPGARRRDIMPTGPGLWRRLSQASLMAVYAAWVATLPNPVDNLGRDARLYARRMQARAELGYYLDKRLSSDQSFLIGDAGIVPYLAHARVIDAFCLNSREMTSPAIHFDRNRFLDWLFSAAPDLLIVHSSSASVLRPRVEYGFYPALVSDQRFLRNYARERVFESEGDSFSYWVYRRR